MISCTEFIPVYSELFAFLEEEGGRPAVERYWDALIGTYFDDSLKKLAREKGVRGCWEYWRRTLSEEASNARLEYDPEADVFTFDMRACPSKGRLLEMEKQGFTSYPAYCEHCPYLYATILEPLGLVYEMDLSRTDRARCAGRVYRKGAPPPRA